MPHPSRVLGVKLAQLPRLIDRDPEERHRAAAQLSSLLDREALPAIERLANLGNGEGQQIGRRRRGFGALA